MNVYVLYEWHVPIGNRCWLYRHLIPFPIYPLPRVFVVLLRNTDVLSYTLERWRYLSINSIYSFPFFILIFSRFGININEYKRKFGDVLMYVLFVSLYWTTSTHSQPWPIWLPVPTLTLKRDIYIKLVQLINEMDKLLNSFFVVASFILIIGSLIDFSFVLHLYKE